MQASTKKLIMVHVKNYQPVIGHKSSMKEGRMYWGPCGPDHWKCGIFDSKIFWIQFIILTSFLHQCLSVVSQNKNTKTNIHGKVHALKIFCNWNHWINFFQYGFKNSNPGYLIHIMDFHLEIGNLMENYDEFAILHCFLRPPW